MLQKDTRVDKLYVVMINLYVCTQVIVYMYVDEQMMWERHASVTKMICSTSSDVIPNLNTTHCSAYAWCNLQLSSLMKTAVCRMRNILNYFNWPGQCFQQVMMFLVSVIIHWWRQLYTGCGNLWSTYFNWPGQCFQQVMTTYIILYPAANSVHSLCVCVCVCVWMLEWIQVMLPFIAQCVDWQPIRVTPCYTHMERRKRFTWTASWHSYKQCGYHPHSNIHLCGKLKGTEGFPFEFYFTDPKMYFFIQPTLYHM